MPLFNVFYIWIDLEVVVVLLKLCKDFMVSENLCFYPRKIFQKRM